MDTTNNKKLLYLGQLLRSYNVLLIIFVTNITHSHLFK